jgi:hypothetical protein
MCSEITKIEVKGVKSLALQGGEEVKLQLYRSMRKFKYNKISLIFE